MNGLKMRAVVTILSVPTPARNGVVSYGLLQVRTTLLSSGVCSVSRVYGLPTICLRFFTVYGPRGRPDMAVHQFIEAMRLDTEIVLYGDGSARRAFTFIDDIVDGIVAALECKKKGFEIVNLGGATSHSVAEVIQELETIFNKRAVIEQRPSQPGDVSYTGANQKKAKELLNFNPRVSLREGLKRTVEWQLGHIVERRNN
eukprot:Filipodium_phascolosomae@DN2422_c0_g1_i3.p1